MQFIIGKQGSTIRHLREAYKIEITVPLQGSNDEIISISGQKELVHQCVKEIMEMVQEKSTEKTATDIIKKFKHDITHDNMRKQSKPNHREWEEVDFLFFLLNNL